MPDIPVQFVGHSTVLLELGGVRILTDPFLRDGLGPIRRVVPSVDVKSLGTVDLVIVSHAHLDHLDLASLKRVARRARVATPAGTGTLLRRAGITHATEVEPGDVLELDGLTITTTPARHPKARLAVGELATPVGYLLEGGDRRVYFAGDTDIFPEMADIGDDLDLAMLPIWGWGPRLGTGHMDPVRAATSLQLLQPRVALPIHWGTLWPVGLARITMDRLVEPPREFELAAQETAPQVRILTLAPGDRGRA